MQHDAEQRCVALRRVPLRCAVLHCVALDRIMLRWILCFCRVACSRFRTERWGIALRVMRNARNSKRAAVVQIPIPRPNEGAPDSGLDARRCEVQAIGFEAA